MEDGALIQATISKNYRDYLKLLAGWYAEGLIDPEFTMLKKTIEDEYLVKRRSPER